MITIGTLVKIAVRNDGSLTSVHVKEYTGRVTWVGPTGIVKVALAPTFRAQRFANPVRESIEVINENR